MNAETNPAALGECLARALAFTATGDASHPYATEIAGARWCVRVNDFSAEPMYTLIIGKTEIGDFAAKPRLRAPSFFRSVMPAAASNDRSAPARCSA